jgi:NADH-quinone oxidoreductase subunit C/D
VPGSDPRVDSVTSIWRGANWFEREVYDLHDVRFRGHPDLQRILTHNGFGDHHPMRRDSAPGLRRHFERSAEVPIAERSPAGEAPPFEAHPTILNLGLSHPAMHGAFRLVARMEGEDHSGSGGRARLSPPQFREDGGDSCLPAGFPLL